MLFVFCLYIFVAISLLIHQMYDKQGLFGQERDRKSIQILVVEICKVRNRFHTFLIYEI